MKLSWLTLEVWKDYLRLVQLYKIIFGFSDIDAGKYLEFSDETEN